MRFFIIGTRQKCRAFIVDDKQVGLIRPDVFEYLQQYPAGNAFIHSVYFVSKMNRQYLYIQSHQFTTAKWKFVVHFPILSVCYPI